jgi:hypothetical protein
MANLAPGGIDNLLVFNGEAVSRDDYVAAVREAVDSVRDYLWRLDDLVIEGGPVAARVTHGVAVSSVTIVLRTASESSPRW